MGFFDIALLLFGVSQFYWFWRARAVLLRAAPSKSVRWLAGGLAIAVYFVLFAFNFEWFGRRHTPTRLTFGEAFLSAPFSWWMASSLVAFLLLIVFWIVAGIVLSPAWIARKARRQSEGGPTRRRFLESAANVVAAGPFVAGGYGLLYGRLDLQTPTQPIHLDRLPKAFDGFRIAQLSDIHIGPFMTAEQIRRYAAIANALKPDLIALTGDFVTWDGSTQYAVVEALSALKAPFGVYGCLGNHDAWAGVEDSITALFAASGIRVLRHERTAIASAGESFNLIGIDFASRRRFGPNSGSFERRFAEGLTGLAAPGLVNILMSHNPDMFDLAAPSGIDLTISGHTHGGQVALEFISPEIAPSRLVTPYVSGRFEKPGGQLYVNRGIGTIGVPIRLGAPPEITLFELKRNVQAAGS